MKIITLVLLLCVALLIGSFAYFAVTDIPVEQSQAIKTIPNDRFFGSS